VEIQQAQQRSLQLCKCDSNQKGRISTLQRRASRPFRSKLLRNHASKSARRYAQATDAYVIAQITAGGTQATAQDADSAGIIGFVATEAPAAYTATKRTAKSFVSGTSIWSLLLGAVDDAGRPIYNAGNPMNNAGSAIPTSIRGNVLGLDYYVDPNMVSTSIDESAFIIEPRSIEIFESPALTLATNVPTTGEIEIMLYGYIAAQATFAGGLRRFNLT
jgi:hypothetical protein